VTRTPPQAKRPHAAPAPTEAALVLVRAFYPMLRQSTPELKNATPPSNARGKRRRPQRLEERKRLTGVRLTELLGGGATTIAVPVNEATPPTL
jgi:hypothetical protein